jgi:hypothetical protein
LRELDLGLCGCRRRIRGMPLHRYRRTGSSLSGLRQDESGGDNARCGVNAAMRVISPLRCRSWTMFASGKGWIRNRTWSDALNTACVVAL